MKRRSFKLNAKKMPHLKKHTPRVKKNNCRQLLLIDNHPIKKSYVSKIKKSSKQIAEYEEKLSQFETTDLRQFENWKNVTFKNENETIQKKKNTLQRLANEVMNCYLIQEELHCHHGKAYNIFLKEEAILEKGTPEEVQSIFGTRTAREKKLQEKIHEEERQEAQEQADFIRFFEDLTGALMDDDHDISNQEALFNEETTRLKIKSTYRQLVRLLHPDQIQKSVIDSFDALTIDKLWKQVQEAYQEEDLEELEMILVQILIKQEKLDHLSISELIQFNLYSQQKSSFLKTEMNKLKLHFAWNFSRQKSYENIRKKCLIEIQEDLDDLDDKIRQLTNELNKMKKSANKENEKLVKKQMNSKSTQHMREHTNQPTR